MPAGLKIEPNFGPRRMGAGPTGIARVHRQTGQIEHVVTVGFQIGHIQANWTVPGELVFSWETGGKSPQRTWTVRGDGSGLRPLYPESSYEWVTHEAYIGKRRGGLRASWATGRWRSAFQQVGAQQAPAFEGAKNTTVAPGQEAEWGPSRHAREAHRHGHRQPAHGRHAHRGRRRQTGSGLWHVHASPDGRWAVGDDFSRSLYLIDRRDGRMRLLVHRPQAKPRVTTRTPPSAATASASRSRARCCRPTAAR